MLDLLSYVNFQIIFILYLHPEIQKMIGIHYSLSFLITFRFIEDGWF